MVLVQDRGQWSVDLACDDWPGETVSFPLVAGYGVGADDFDPFAPRADRDPAAAFDVPPAVRWLVRVLLSHGFAADGLAFRRTPVTVHLEDRDGGWVAALAVDDVRVDLPAFEGFHR